MDDNDMSDQEDTDTETYRERPGPIMAREENAILPEQPAKPQSNLHKLPTEIRLSIYELLLVADKSIRVHSGWKLLYKRQQLGTQPNILRTCRHIYNEAIEILYGRNTFLYQLRDRIPRVIDIDQLAHIDDDDTTLPSNTHFNGEDTVGDAGDESDSDSDWQEDTTTSRKRARPAVTETDINVDKHLSHFRHIIIEAEKNRYKENTKRLMANAIRTFENKGLRGKDLPNIHSLTVRVTPRWEAARVADQEAGDEDGNSGYYTFVDFFSKESPIMRAVRDVDCWHLCVELMGCTSDGVAKRGRSFHMDMRYLQLMKQVRRTKVDMWRGDHVIQRKRSVIARRALHLLGTLDRHVADACEECIQRTGWMDEIDHLL